MSLLDTIKAARDEAEEAGTLPSANKKDAKAERPAADDETASSSAGFSKRSTARAKPAREAAGSVRTGSGKEQTKEEKKAERDRKRSESDVAYEASQIILNQQEGYAKARRIWWILVGVGLACTLGSWLILRYMQTTSGGTLAESEVLAAVSMGLMVAAYVLIIGAFIYDLRKIRPMRKHAEEVTSGMTDRRRKRLIAEEEQRKKESKK